MIVAIIYGLTSILLYLVLFAALPILDNTNIFFFVLVIHLVISIICIRNSKYKNMGRGLLTSAILLAISFFTLLGMAFH